VHNSLDNRLRPTRGETASVSFDFAGLGGSTRYARVVGTATKYWSLGPGWIASLTAEGGYIKGLKDRGPGQDDVLLTDRFFLGEPEIRGFDIRGVGPRVVRRFYGADDDNNPATPPPLLPLHDRGNQDDALGGTAYYLGRAELEIPLGSGARELGLRPSVFLDAGAVFGIKRPALTVSPYPDGIFIPERDASGNALYTQITEATLSGTTCTATKSITTTNPINPNPPACLTSANNIARGNSLPAFTEEFYGNSAKPRVAVGVGVNWNSPFGPFRINFAYALLKEPGDDAKRFSFNVGTQF
jgi:outer membrane protein insertion porin family